MPVVDSAPCCLESATSTAAAYRDALRIISLSRRLLNDTPRVSMPVAGRRLASTTASSALPEKATAGQRFTHLCLYSTVYVMDQPPTHPHKLIAPTVHGSSGRRARGLSWSGEILDVEYASAPSGGVLRSCQQCLMVATT